MLQQNEEWSSLRYRKQSQKPWLAFPSLQWCSVSAVVQIRKSMFFPQEHRDIGFSWLGEGHCMVSGRVVFTWQRLTFLDREKRNNAASQEGGGKGEQNISWYTVEAEQHFRLLNRFNLFSVLPTPAASFDANKSLLCSFRSTNLLCTFLLYLSGGA